MANSLSHRLNVARATNNMQLVSLLEQEKKQIEADLPHTESTSILQRMKKVWTNLVEMFAHAEDLQIWTTIDGSNAIWWHAFNPRTGQSVITDSETEMRLWIEANYWEN